MSAPLLWRRLRAAGHDGARLARLCQSLPDLVAPVLTENALRDVLAGGQAWLDDAARATLARTLEIADSGERAFEEADERFRDVAACPIVFAWRSVPASIYAPAAVVEGIIRIGATQEIVGRWPFQEAVTEALSLADAMAPGPERPVLRLRRDEWAALLDERSAGFAVFFHAVCLLLGLPPMGDLVISAGIESGRVVPAGQIWAKAGAVRRSGRRVFIVCGDDGALSARNAEPSLAVIAIPPGMSVANAFGFVIGRLVAEDLWRPSRITAAARFLLERARMLARHGADVLEDVLRVNMMLELGASPPGEDEDLDALRLDAMLLQCRLQREHRQWEAMARSIHDLDRLLRELEGQRACPSNFEDAYCAWPLLMADFCRGRGVDADIREHLAEARRRAAKFWPPNRRREEEVERRYREIGGLPAPTTD